MSNRFEGEHGRCLVVTEPDANELPGATARRAGATARALGAAGFTGDLPEERRTHLLHECVVDTRFRVWIRGIPLPVQSNPGFGQSYTNKSCCLF